MSGLFERRDAGAARQFPLADGPRPTTGELIGAGFQDAKVRTDSWWLTYRRRRSALDALASRLGPEGVAIQQEWKRSITVPDAAIETLFERVRAAAGRDPGAWGDVPQDRDALFGQIDADLKREVDEAGRVLARGFGLGDAAAGLVGTIGGYGSTPANLLMAIPGAGQMSLARRVLFEAQMGAVAELIELPTTVEMEDRLGLDPSDPVLQVAAGAAFSAGLPVAGRGVKLAWKGARAVTNGELLARARSRVETMDPETRAAAARLADHERAMAQDPAGDAPAHEGALGAADRALAVGDPALVPDRFDASQPGAGPRRASLGDRVRGVESGGRLDAANPNSSALGPDQFIASTWLETVRRHAPQLAQGRTDAEVLALRTDDRTSAAMRDAYLRDLRADLGARGLPVHDGAVYLAYFAGPGGAARALSAPPDAPVREVLTDAQIAANATVRHKGKALPDFTAQDLVDWAKAKMGLAPGAFTDLPMPSQIATVRAGDAFTDAERFQYKLGGDAEGVTDRLLAETRWDPTAGIGLIFWERGDGRIFVADGHQRAGLARRLEAQGQDPIDLQGFMFREAEGWTPEAVRAIAALRNIRGETGTAADAAKFLRDYPELAGQVTRSRDFMRRADALSRLAPDPFMAVINGAIPENYGAVIGRAAPGDERMQRAILKAFRQIDPANETQADLIARDVRRMGLEREADAAQGDLFAEFDFGASAVGDRARVLDRTLRDLKQDKAVFDRLTREAERIEKEGNRLATDANARRAQLNQRIIQAVLYAADEPGPIRDALDAAAKSARGRGVAAAARDFADAVRAGLDGDSVGRAFNRSADGGAAPARGAGGGEGRVAPNRVSDEALRDPPPVRDADAGETPRDLFADPAGPGARAQTEMLEADLFGEPAPARAPAARPDSLLARMDPAEADMPVLLGDGPDARSLREVLQELDDDAEALAVLDLCAPRAAS